MRALILSLVLALLAPGIADAQTTTPTRRPSCDLNFQGMNFGPYSSLDQAPNTANALIEVTCDPPDEIFAVRVFISEGSSGNPLDRTMDRGRDELHYNVYADPSYNRVAGDGSNGTVAPVRIIRGPGRATIRLYGKIWPGQAVREGDYDDRLRVTVEF